MPTEAVNDSLSLRGVTSRLRRLRRSDTANAMTTNGETNPRIAMRKAKMVGIGS